ncbi:11150_t:CDS:2, partial [Paraglomus occultum]
NLTCNTPKPSSELNDTWISSLTPRVKSLILDFPPFDAADTRLVSRILPDTVTKTIKSRSPYDTVDDTDFQRACLKIKVLAQEAYRWFHNEIQELKDFENMYCEELIWCGEHKITFTKSIELYFAGDNYTALLLITSSLEQLLGDVLHLVNITSQVPPLFRDLLLERPLADILGEDFVFLLRCLFGPPNSMNLRNIIWHGFICEEEFSPTPAIWYYCLIVVLAMSVCAKVKFSEASCEVLIRRHTKKAFTGLYHLPQNFNWDYLTKSDFEQMYELILNECVPHSIPPHIHLLSILNQTFFVIPTTIPTWRRAFEYMYTGQPILFLILALPLLEHSLRRLYICLNQDVSDHRLCTGNVGEYFLTMDVMLRKSVSMQCDIAKVLAQKELVEERKNGIFDQLKGDVMDLLEDLFVHVSGPRLRDRIAHGDYDFTLLCTTSSAHNDPVFAHVVHLIRHLFE